MSTTRILEFTGADLRVTKLGVSNNVEVGTANLFVDATTGNVGIGTTVPTQALDVHGNVTVQKESTMFAGSDVIRQLPKHDRPLTKYPEIVLTSAASYAYQEGYKVQRSSENVNNPAYNLFDGNIANRWLARTSDSYNASSPYEYTGSNDITTTDGTPHEGAWVRLELPKKIRLAYTKIIDNTEPPTRTPGKVTFLGSNNDTDWHFIKEFSGMSPDVREYTYHINETTYYKHYAFVVKNISDDDAGIDLGEWELYGTEEGDESVDIVHTSIPNKPGQQHLGVYWDANNTDSYSGSGTTVTDLSGNGVTGTLTGVGFDSEYNAFTFDGVNDRIYTTSSGLGTGGAFDHSFAFWFKINRNITNNDYVVTFGEESNDNMIAVNISGNTLIHFDNWGRGVITGDIVRLGTWYHVACTHTGSATGDIYNQLIYVNGIRQTTSPTGTGTLAFTSNRITIGARPGTNNSNTPAAFLDGAVSSVRFFKGKVLNPDQVRELYEYDAPRFGHRTNVVALHKGNLGVGVTAPTSRFEVAGREDLQEYPPRGMTGYETYVEGHGVFKASASSLRNGHETWQAFDKTSAYKWPSDVSGGDSFGGTDTAYNGSNRLASSTALGAWLKLSCPYQIKLKRFSLYTSPNSEQPEDFIIYGSVDDNTWEQLFQETGVAQNTTDVYYDVNSTSHYMHFAIVITRTISSSTIGTVNEWRLFGTPAPSGLEDGHLTLGKALTAPRFTGHAAGAETPRVESLVVHYDTTVDSVVAGSSVVDISGQRNNGTLNGNAAYSSSDRALTFDGTGDDVTATFPSSPGDNTFGVSFWVKRAANSDVYCPFFMGTTGTYTGIGMDIYSNGTVYWFIYNGKFIVWNGVSGLWFPVGSWTHVAVSHTSGTDFANLNKVWINGVEVTSQGTAGGTGDLTLSADDNITVGSRNDANHLNGSISNFKLWNVALTAEEVAQEYALGRTGKSLNVTDTAVCLGGTVPRAQLDVRGSIAVDGIVGSSTTGGLVIPSGTIAQTPTVASIGMIRFNTELYKLQFYNGSAWSIIGNINATGGTITTSGAYQIHTFTTSGTFTAYSGGDVEYVIVAGGGGGGSEHGGAGGAGGYISGSAALADGVYTITVGGGGSGGANNNGTNGSDSVFNSLTALGGGGGGRGYSSVDSNAGLSGGSGGGGAPFSVGGTTSNSAQGNNGGNGLASGIAGHGGGGGGAGGAGGNALTSGSNGAGISGAGGLGISSSITGTAVIRAGGGSGGRWGGTNTNPGTIGDVGTVQGGGGRGGAQQNSGYNAVAGTANTGGGGGGGSDNGGYGGAGGSGIVIIRYLL